MLTFWSPGDSENDLRVDSGSSVEGKAVEEAELPLLSLQEGRWHQVLAVPVSLVLRDVQHCVR